MNSGRMPACPGETASPLRVDPSRCSRMRFSESRCERCAVACPRSAIRLDGGLKVEEERCAGCLTCTAVCPSGALEADVDFCGMTSGLAVHRFPVLVISCGRRHGAFHRRLPCLGMLSAEHLVTLFARSDSVVHLDASACSRCAAGAMLPHLAARLEWTEGESGLPLGSRVRLILDEKELEFRKESLDRRGFFRSFRNLAFPDMTGSPASPSRERKAVSYMDKVLPMRRKVLAAGLASLPPETARKVKDAFSFSMTFGESCDGCIGCVKVCPAGALSETGASGPRPSFPRFDPERCTGCGLCAEFCLSGAICLDPTG